MACCAIGRCRICAKRHSISVFGNGETQHLFIEKANLKLIILNTVCLICIEKIEGFIEKMDLEMDFNNYIQPKDENDFEQRNKILQSSDNSSETVEITTNREKEIITSIKTENDSLESTPMDLDNQSIEQFEKKINNEAKIPITNAAETNNTQIRTQCLGDLQSSIISTHCSNSVQRIEKDVETLYKSRRKRPRILCKIQPAEERVEPIIENSILPQSDLLTDTESSASKTMTSTDIGTSEYTNVKKGGRFLSCEFCKKEFTHAGDLNKHRRRHTGEKPYECYQCKRKFAHASNLARHQRVHSGERPFSCPKCKRTFTRKDKLAIHSHNSKC